LFVLISCDSTQTPLQMRGLGSSTSSEW
jgi:hypothetical protein